MRTHFPGVLREVRSAARQDELIARHSFLTNSKEEEARRTYGETIRSRSGGANPRESGLVNRKQVPLLGRRSQTRNDWDLDKCRLVAQSTEPEDLAPILPAVRPHGRGVQLRRGVQEP